MRLDDNYKQNENELNIGRNREMRQNPEYRDNENENNMERNRQMRLDDNYKKNENELNIGKIPKKTETENLKFPYIPDYISNLTPIEERMVSPYIPFMQIKALQPYALNSQLSLLGSIVNIATDVNEMVSELPRKFNELSVVQIKLKRHVEHQSNYMYETIKPSNVCKALKFVKDTPLYKENNIEISTDFFTHYEENNENMNFIVEEQDLQKSQNTTGENIVKKINEFKRNENELVDTYELNDEVLLIDNNEFSSKLTISVCDDKIIDQIPELQKQKLLSNMKTKKRQECGGLHYQLQLKLGIKYMITTNINVEDGLVNGAYGKEYIRYGTMSCRPRAFDHSCSL
uniref:ATP-dependent DNA helicase n=1 Tax=Trichogramma kaykai TaxID=54128 RepID=A0ABD2WYZ8_9HYME